MILHFSTCTKRQRLQNANVSQELQKGTKLHHLYPSYFTLLMFILQLLRTWRVVKEQPSSRPPFPAFNFHHFRTQYLIGPTLLRNRFCESSSKHKAAVQCASRVAFIMLLPFLYLSIYPITLYACRSSDAEKSPLYLQRQILQRVSAAFYSFTYSLELV